MEGGIGSVILGFILWKITGNIWVGSFGAVVFWPILSAILRPIKQAIQMIGVKAPPFYSLMKQDCRTSEVMGKGTRVLVITGSDIMDISEQQRLQVYEALYSDGVEKFLSKKEFAQRITSMKNNKHPLCVCASVCNVGHLPSMTKCFSVWRKMLATEPFLIGETDKDFFVEDLVYTIPGQEGEKMAGIAFCFEKDMPIDETVMIDDADKELSRSPVFHEGMHEITL